MRKMGEKWVRRGWNGGELLGEERFFGRERQFSFIKTDYPIAISKSFFSCSLLCLFSW